MASITSPREHALASQVPHGSVAATSPEWPSSPQCGSSSRSSFSGGVYSCFVTSAHAATSAALRPAERSASAGRLRGSRRWAGSGKDSSS